MEILNELRKLVDPNNECCCEHCLAHKCKEWAISKGWVLHEVRNLKEYIIYFSGDFREPSNDFRADTEPEAIFKATSYIMEQLKQKD